MRTYKRHIVSIIFALAALLCMSCDLLDGIMPRRGSRPVIQILVGDIAVTREGSMQLGEAGFLFEPHDSVIIPEESKVRIGAGQSQLHSNEGSFFAVGAPINSDSGVFVISRGEYFFMARRAAPLAFTFGDIFVRMVDADAAFTVDETGRLAEFFVVRGFAVAERGNTQRLVSACKAVVFDASGISEDEGVTALRGNALERLETWVGKSVINTAKTEGRCNIEPLTGVFVERAPDPEPPPEEIFVPAPIILEVVEATPRPRMTPSPSPIAATFPERLPPPVIPSPPPVLPPPPPPPPRVIEQEPVIVRIDTTTRPIQRPSVLSHILGPARIHVTEEVTFRAITDDSAGVVAAYRWTVENGGDVIFNRTVLPQLLHTFTNMGESFLTLEAMDSTDAVLARHKVRFNVRGGEVIARAGGPYRAELGTPVWIYGNAKSRFGTIVRHEWYLSSITAPDIVIDSVQPVRWTFVDEPGEKQIIYRAVLATGESYSDTAIVTVTEPRATLRADAGGRIVAERNKNINLIGRGTSTDSRIVRFEWDCAGNGRFVNAKNGRITCKFNEFTNAVLRVTDAEGNIATDTLTVVICPLGMQLVRGGQFCIDRHEFPNRARVHPQAEVTYYEAVAECEKVDRRLCTAEEWQRACRDDNDPPIEGVHAYPYGTVFSETACNTLGNPRGMNRAMLAGSFTACHGSGLRISDMSGNVAEWVAGAPGHSHAQAFGGWYQSDADSSHCGAYMLLERSNKFIHTGFRCCK